MRIKLNSFHQQTVTNLCAMEYLVQVTDANGCMQENVKMIKEPERDDWTMNGNTGSDPASNFIGTTDEADLVFKTNAEERLRIGADGNILINRFTGGAGMAYFDSLGRLQSGFTSAPCNNVQTGWETSFTPFLIYACSPNRVAIGDYQIPSSARFYVNGQTHLNGNLGVGMAASNGNVRLSVSGVSFLDGAVGIGMEPQTGYSLTVDGKVGVREVYVRSSGAWPDYVFSRDYRLESLEKVKGFIERHGHLPGMPPALVIEREGQALGEIQKQQQEHIEKLYLYILQLEQRIGELEKRK
jgi:hypothetical protein